jgi:hypothetical protein
MSIEWYYIWSDNYRFFHEILKDTIKEPEFIMNPIYVDQAYFDTNLYKVEGKHSWNGCSLKIDLLIERLKTSSSKYILFTDVDLIPKKDIYKNLKQYIDTNQTQVFLQENSHLNIGFVLLKVCPEVIEFWESVKLKMHEVPSHDQEYVNTLIQSYNHKWTMFDPQIFTCSNIWNRVTDFSIMQPLSSCLGKELDLAEKIFNTAQHIYVEPYMKYVPESIIPYIYKIQDILYHTYKNSAVNS